MPFKNDAVLHQPLPGSTFSAAECGTLCAAGQQNAGLAEAFGLSVFLSEDKVSAVEQKC